MIMTKGNPRHKKYKCSECKDEISAEEYSRNEGFCDECEDGDESQDWELDAYGEQCWG